MPLIAPVTWRTASEIEQEATNLRKKYRIGPPPVDPYVLATRMGILVYQSRFEDKSIAGALRRRKGETQILARRGDPSIRQAFTVAHELGHYALHWGFQAPPDQEDESISAFVDADSELYRHGPEVAGASGDEEQDRRAREIQANMFAASLLMPEVELRDEWQRTQSIQELARRFEVSREAMRYRINQLGLW